MTSLHRQGVHLNVVDQTAAERCLMSLNLRQISSNACSILTSDVMNRATSFVLYALVARHLGAREFGQLSLALTLFYVFQVLAMGGLKTLIVRQVAKDLAQTSVYFVNGSLLAVLSSIGSIAVLWVLVRLMHYSSATSLFILLLSLGLLPYTLSAVCEAIFQAWQQMRYISYVNVPANLAKIGAAFLLLSRHRGLDAIVLILLSAFTLVAAIEVWIVLRNFPARHASFDVRFSLATMRSAITFLGIDGTVAIMSSLNFLFLSKLAGEVQVGLYNAATQVVVPLLLVYQSIAQSIFPVMCRKLEPGYQSLKQITEYVLELLLVLALPAVAGLLFVGGWLLSVLYKNSALVQAFPALRIIAWVLVFQVFTSVLGQALVASDRESVTLRIVAVDAVINLAVGWPLISYLGLRGAAIALLLTRMVDCCLHFIPASRLLNGIPLAKIIWKPALAAACMVAYLAVPASPSGILTGIWATLIYCAVLVLLTIWAGGGYRQLLNKYRLALSE
jgi:O-antigen/teichoic acid export membrane protein